MRKDTKSVVLSTKAGKMSEERNNETSVCSFTVMFVALGVLASVVSVLSTKISLKAMLAVFF